MLVVLLGRRRHHGLSGCALYTPERRRQTCRRPRVPNRFRQTRREIPRRIIQARLCLPSELSGALNKALDGLERVRKRGWFTETKASRGLLRRYQSANDALAAWLDEHTVAAPETMIPQSELHGAYATHCRRARRSPASKQIFGRRLRTLRPNVEPTQRTLCGRRTWVYAGIALRENPAGDQPL